MRFLITLLILVVSEVLYCTLLIGSDPIIIGQINMTGEPVSYIDIATLATVVSLVSFPIIVGIFLFLSKKLIKAPILVQFILLFLYIVPWLGVAGSVAGFYEDMYGATWIGIEFSLFYQLSLKALLLAPAIITPAYIFNRWLLNKSPQHNPT